jgi:hypothetical protein
VARTSGLVAGNDGQLEGTRGREVAGIIIDEAAKEGLADNVAIAIALRTGRIPNLALLRFTEFSTLTTTTIAKGHDSLRFIQMDLGFTTKD